MSLLTNWRKSLRRVFAGSRAAQQQRRLGLESLEDRAVPATLQILGGALTYTAANGVANRLDMFIGDNAYVFRDAGETINVIGIAGAMGSGTNVVTLPATSVPAAGISINLGDQNDTLTLSSALHAVSVKAGLGNDTVDVGNYLSGVLASFSAPVTINGEAGSDTVRVNDYFGYQNTYVVTSNQVTRSGGFAMSYAGAENLALTGGFDADTFDIRSTMAGTRTTVNGGTGNDTFRVGSAANSLDTIQGALTLVGGTNVAGFADQVTFMDQGSAAGRTYTFRADQMLSRTGSALIAYAGVERMTLNAGAFADSVVVLATPADMPLTLNMGDGHDSVTVGTSAYSLAHLGARLTVSGGAGTDRLTLNDQANTASMTYIVKHDAVNYGLFSTLMNYAAMEGLTLIGGSGGNLIDVSSVAVSTPVTIRAGAGNDTVEVSQQGVNGTVSVDGQAGTDMLSYFFHTADVRVNLARGTATNVAGGVRNIEDVTGGSGNDILVGNDANNILWGGAGRDILIGRAGADKLIAEHGEDILVGDSTAHDLSPVRLEDLMREWKRTDLPGTARAQYKGRVHHLLGLTPGGLNGATSLTPAHVTSDGVADFLDGGLDLDWYFTTGADTTVALWPHEYVNATPTPAIVGDVIATVVGGTLFITEAPDSEGLRQSVLISRLPNGNIRITGGRFSESAPNATLINGMASVEIAVPWGLVVNLGEGSDRLIFGTAAGAVPAFAHATIQMGEGDARDEVLINALETSGSVSITTGGGNDLVYLTATRIGDGAFADQFTVNTGAGADTVFLDFAVDIHAVTNIQTYTSLDETDADVVYFEEVYVRGDMNIRTGGGADRVLVTDPEQPFVAWLGLRTDASVTIDTGAGDDDVSLRAFLVAGNLSVQTGAGADTVEIDGRLIPIEASVYRPRVSGNTVVQTYAEPEEADTDSVTLLDGQYLGGLAVRMGGGDDRFQSEYIETVMDDMVVDMGEGNDEAEVSAWVSDLLMVSMGQGDDVLRLSKTWAEHLLADGGTGSDTLTRAYNSKANNFHLAGWEVMS